MTVGRAVAGLAIVALAACSQSSEAQPRSGAASLPIPTSTQRSAWVAVAEGILGGEADAYAACLWLDEGPDRIALVWPAGYRAAGSPLSVFDAHGQRIATVGDHLMIGGMKLPSQREVRQGCSNFDSVWSVYRSDIVDGPMPHAQYRIATRSPGGSDWLAAGGADLQGQANSDGTACFWNGTGEPFIWPAGYSAGGSPLRVFDPAGRVMAVVGWPVLYGGGNGAINQALLGCPEASEAWFMGSIRQTP